MSDEFKTTHELDFLVAAWHMPGINRFKVGTCSGIYTVKPGEYIIIAVVNEEIGNGHFDDVLEWFENSCKRDGYDLRIAEVWNEKLKHHLVNKRGFINDKGDDVLKIFKPETNQQTNVET